jgi:hypothetical protein
MTSTTVGFASQWSLSLKEIKPKEGREEAVPNGDVVIFYPPQGAYRIIECDEQQNRLYFEDIEFLWPKQHYQQEQNQKDQH